MVVLTATPSPTAFTVVMAASTFAAQFGQLVGQPQAFVVVELVVARATREGSAMLA